MVLADHGSWFCLALLSGCKSGRVEKAGALLPLEQRVLPEALEFEMCFGKLETGF